MELMENIRLLYCLNEAGATKVNEILKDIVKNPEDIKVSYEGLLQELKEGEEQRKIEYNQKLELLKQKEIENENEIEQLEEKYKLELKMIRDQTAYYDQRDIIHVIEKTSKASSYWNMLMSFNWGYIQGLKAERTKRKKVQA